MGKISEVLKERKIYLIGTILCLFICFLILFPFDGYPFIRGFLGDMFVMTLMYSFIKIFFNIKSLGLGLLILLFAYTIEFAQYFGLIYHLGWEDFKIAQWFFGSVFDWKDLLAYTIGSFLSVSMDKFLLQSVTGVDG